MTNRNGLFSLLPPSLGSGNETAEKEIGQQVFGERLTGGVTAKNRLGSATVNFTRKEQRGKEDLSHAASVIFIFLEETGCNQGRSMAVGGRTTDGKTSPLTIRDGGEVG